MDQRDELADVARIRRRLLKASAWAVAGALAGVVPYQRPRLRGFLGTRSAWAQTSGSPILVLQGALGVGPAGSAENTGSDWWQLTVPTASTEITIVAAGDGFLDVELFLFAPGVDPTIGVNLLTGSFAPYNTQGLAGGESVTLTLGGPGAYLLAIEDARSPRDETAGKYTITVTGDRALGGAKLVADETNEIQVPRPSPGPLPDAAPD